MVISTLQEKEGSRKAYRLVGGVLVERTVADVLPSVQQNLGGIKVVLGKLSTDLQQREKQAAAWKIKYSIRTQEDMQAQNAQAKGRPSALS